MRVGGVPELWNNKRAVLHSQKNKHAALAAARRLRRRPCPVRQDTVRVFTLRVDHGVVSSGSVLDLPGMVPSVL